MSAIPDGIIDGIESSLQHNSISLHAPAGHLFLDCRTIKNVGICVEKVKSASPLLNKIHVGDVILGVDGNSTGQYSTVAEFAKMIVVKESSERILTVAPAEFAAPILREISKKMEQKDNERQRESSTEQIFSKGVKGEVHHTSNDEIHHPNNEMDLSNVETSVGITRDNSASNSGLGEKSIRLAKTSQGNEYSQFDDDKDCVANILPVTSDASTLVLSSFMGGMTANTSMCARQLNADPSRECTPQNELNTQLSITETKKDTAKSINQRKKISENRQTNERDDPVKNNDVGEERDNEATSVHERSTLTTENYIKQKEDPTGGSQVVQESEKKSDEINMQAANLITRTDSDYSVDQNASAINSTVQKVVSTKEMAIDEKCMNKSVRERGLSPAAHGRSITRPTTLMESVDNVKNSTTVCVKETNVFHNKLRCQRDIVPHSRGMNGLDYRSKNLTVDSLTKVNIVLTEGCTTKKAVPTRSAGALKLVVKDNIVKKICTPKLVVNDHVDKKAHNHCPVSDAADANEATQKDSVVNSENGEVDQIHGYGSENNKNHTMYDSEIGEKNEKLNFRQDSVDEGRVHRCNALEGKDLDNATHARGYVAIIKKRPMLYRGHVESNVHTEDSFQEDVLENTQIKDGFDIESNGNDERCRAFTTSSPNSVKNIQEDTIVMKKRPLPHERHEGSAKYVHSDLSRISAIKDRDSKRGRLDESNMCHEEHCVLEKKSVDSDTHGHQDAMIKNSSSSSKVEYVGLTKNRHISSHVRAKEDVKVKEVNFERKDTSPRERISLKENSHNNLTKEESLSSKIDYVAPTMQKHEQSQADALDKEKVTGVNAVKDQSLNLLVKDSPINRTIQRLKRSADSMETASKYLNHLGVEDASKKTLGTTKRSVCDLAENPTKILKVNGSEMLKNSPESPLKSRNVDNLNKFSGVEKLSDKVNVHYHSSDRPAATNSTKDASIITFGADVGKARNVRWQGSQFQHVRDTKVLPVSPHNSSSNKPIHGVGNNTVNQQQQCESQVLTQGGNASSINYPSNNSTYSYYQRNSMYNQFLAGNMISHPPNLPQHYRAPALILGQLITHQSIQRSKNESRIQSKLLNYPPNMMIQHNQIPTSNMSYLSPGYQGVHRLKNESIMHSSVVNYANDYHKNRNNTSISSTSMHDTRKVSELDPHPQRPHSINQLANTPQSVQQSYLGTQHFVTGKNSTSSASSQSVGNQSKESVVPEQNKRNTRTTPKQPSSSKILVTPPNTNSLAKTIGSSPGKFRNERNHNNKSTITEQNKGIAPSTSEQPPSCKVMYTPPKTDSLIKLKGLFPGKFTNEQLVKMPVWFSFIANNQESVESARSKNKKWQARSSTIKPARVSILIKEVQSDEFPEGWTVQYFQRSEKRRIDRFWFSPKTKKRFRSKVGVKLFLAALITAGGNEDKAFQAIKQHIR